MLPIWWHFRHTHGCIRAIGYQFFPSSISVRAFFDDLGVVLTNSEKDTPHLLRLFRFFKAASGLTLNFSKGFILPLQSQLRPKNRDFIVAISLLSPDFFIKYAARYLGILIGSEAWQRPWALVLPN
jgi:hypothetical protein